MNVFFNRVIVDSPTPLDSDIGSILNIFTETEISLLDVESNHYLRLFDLSLLDKLQNTPVIISHHIDLSAYQKISHPAGLAIEVANKQDIAEACKHNPDLLIAKSFESSGIAKECSALILYQLLSTQSLPFSIHANTGYELFQAYLTTTVYGIILPLKYLREDTTSVLRFNLDKLTSLQLEVAGGPPKANFYQQMLATKGSQAFITETYQLNLWEKPLKPNEKASIKPKLLRYKEIAGYKNSATIQACFYQDTPAAHALNVRLPIVQGPMSGVTITAEFAEAVYQSGAFPFLALANLSNQAIENIVAKTAAQQISFGVGIVAVSLSDEDFDLQVHIFEKYQPTLVLIGTPQLNHIQRLLKSNLKIAVHAPNKALFKALYKMGVRCFVIEGGEAGGHISSLGGLTAWQEIFNEIREQSLQDKVHLILAGGIKGLEAKNLITALLNFYGFENSLKISLQLGSTFLATRQVLDLTPLNKGFQEQLFNIDDTFVTGESLSRGVRQLAIRNSEKTVINEWSIFNANLSHDDKKKQYERLYQGGLQRAIASEIFVESGSYMAGSVCALLDIQLSLKDILLELIDPAPAQTIQETQEPIAIVGIGLKLPGAETVAEHFYNIFHQRCFITDMPEGNFNREIYLSEDKEEELASYTSLGAYINKLEDDLSQYRIPPIIAQQMSRSQKMALDAAHKALKDAGYFEKPFNKERTAVIMGAGGGNNIETLSKINWPEIRSRLMTLGETAGIDLDTILDEYESRYFEKVITEDTRPGELVNIIASRISSVFDFKGETHTIDAACAASLASVAHAMCLLRNHSCDVVLAGGTEERMDKKTYIEFSRIGAISASGCFPFDSKADGFVLGEGAIIYVLKRYSDALKFGDKIYAVINGWGASSDGAGKGITAPSKEGQNLAIKRAYQDAQMSPALVDYLECHATATKVGDSTEFEGLSELLKTHNIEKKPVLGASKAMIGHLRTGAGAAGILQSLFVINSRHYPATINFQKHAQGSQLPFDILKLPKKIAHDNTLVCSVSAFGFGGTNYQLILSSAEDNSAPSVLSEQQMELPIYKFTGNLAWVCPGQGSQYEGMLAAYKNEPYFIQLAAQASTIFAEYSNINLITLLTEVNPTAKAKNNALLKSTEISQPAIFLASIVIGRKLTRLGIKPDLFIGHSLGEFSALCLADMISFEDVFRIVCLRGKLMSADTSENAGNMVAIMGDEDLAKQLLLQTEHYAVCANLNSYNQTIISCTEEALKDILQAAQQINIRATPLKVARGFHSRFVSNCVNEITQALENCQFYYPSNRVTANIRNQSYPYYPERSLEQMNQEDRSLTISLLKRQIDHPVHFVNQIQSAYASGIRRFIEAGPGNILTRLIEDINQGKYLQTIYINKQGEKPFDFSTLAKRLQEDVLIKRSPLAKREPTQKKTIPKAKLSTSAKRSVIDEIRTVVANISGYQPENIDDDAEFERDLGIDTLKIFEILAQLRGNILPEELTDFRELNSVNKILARCPEQIPQRGTEPQSPLNKIREVVASISGYDLKNLDNKAEFERDLGIDTLKIFEIIAQLRGTILAEELTDFRNLNSIEKLYAARDQALTTETPQAKPEKELVIYQYKQHQLKDLPLLTINLNDFIIDADNGFSTATLKSPYKLLVFKVAADENDLRNRIHTLLYNKTREFIEEKAQKIIYISYGTEALEEASILSISAFVKSLAKDYNDTEWHYNHFEQLPDLANLGNQLISGIGLQKQGDLVLQGKMQKMQGFQTQLTEIPALLSTDDHIVVTGGARGITSHLVKKLYAVCSARFTLIGRSQDYEDWIQVLDPQRICYLSINIADNNAVAEYRSQLSDCTILIHAAGIDHSKNFMHKSHQEFFEVIDVKVAGLFNLLTLMSPANIRALVLFSSTAGYRGNHGQADYAVANAVLNSKIAQFPCLSLAWTAWAELGMASRGFVHDILTAKGARFIGLNEGSDIFQNALASFLANPFTIHAQLLIAAKISDADDLYCPEAKAIHTIADLDKSFITEISYDSQKHPELLDHQFKGEIFVPGSVMLGAVMHTIDEHIKLDNLTVKLAKVEFHSPLIVLGSVANRLKITRNKNDILVEEIKQQLTKPILSFALKSAQETEPLNLTYIKDRYQQILPYLPITESPCAPPHSGLGEHFHILESISLSQGIIRTTLHLQAGKAELLQRHFSIAKVFEACFQSCIATAHLLHNSKPVYLPSSLDKALISFQALKQTTVLQIYIELLPSQSKQVCFNVLAINDLGEQVIHIKEFTASPIFDANRENYYLFKNTLIKEDSSEAFFADIAQLNQQFDNENFFTVSELNEISALNSSKRKNEKKAGKIACKILNNWTSLTEKLLINGLAHTEVLSTDQAVQVLMNGKLHAKYPYYSISHTAPIIYVARSIYPIGIDIEKIRPLDELTIKSIYGGQNQAVEKFLTESRVEPKLQDLFPLILFTQKEAALKADGTGLAKGLDNAFVEKYSINDATIKVHDKTYTVSSKISSEFVVSKALLIPPKHKALTTTLPRIIKQVTKFQQALLQEESQASSSYSLNHAIEFNQPVNEAYLCTAINGLFKEHEVLRSRFSDDASQVFIAPYVEQTFTIETSKDSIAVIEEQFINDYAHYLYHLSNEDLYQIKLYQTAEGTTLLLMNFHHLILDCYNAFILSELLLKNYQQLLEGKALVPGKHHQYYDLGIEAHFKPGKSFWTSYLKDVETFKFERPEAQKQHNAKHFKTLSHFNKTGLEHFCRSQSMTLFAGLLGILKLTFLKLYEIHDMVFFIPFSTKNTQNQQTLGSFVHLLPVRSKIEQSLDNEHLFKRLKDNLYTAIEHQNEQIETRAIHQQNHGIITQLINSDDQDILFTDNVKRRNTDGKNKHFPLILSFINCPDAVHLDITYNAQIVSEQQLDDILNCFQQEFNLVINNIFQNKSTKNFISPRTPTEKKLADIWQDVLDKKAISLNDNFFALGGNSLLAVRITVLIQQQFQIAFPLASLFEFATIAELAEQLDKVIHQASTNKLGAIKILPRKPRTPI